MNDRQSTVCDKQWSDGWGSHACGRPIDIFGVHLIMNKTDGGFRDLPVPDSNHVCSCDQTISDAEFKRREEAQQ